MPRLETIDPLTDSGEGADLLNGPLKEKQINIFKGLAVHPPVLEAFLTWAQGSKSGALTPAECEIVQLVAAEKNECTYCASAHTLVAQGTGLTEDECLNIRRGFSDDPKQQTLINFTAEVLEQRGSVSDSSLQTFMDAGYSTQAAIEVAAGISVITFTSFYNHIHDTEVDFPEIPAV